MSVIVDVTERRRVEEALRLSEDRYRQLVELSRDAIFVEIDGKFAFANPAALRLFGAARAEDLVGRSTLDFVHPDDRETARSRVRRYEAGEAPPFVELRYNGIDGSEHVAEVAGTAFFHQGKRAILAVLRDVTERKRAAAALRESEAWGRGVMDNVADGVITIDEAGRIESFNPAAEAMFGYRAEEMIGRNVSELMTAADNDCHDEYLRRYRETGQGAIIGIGPREVAARRKDGSVFGMELTVGEMVRANGTSSSAPCATSASASGPSRRCTKAGRCSTRSSTARRWCYGPWTPRVR